MKAYFSDKEIFFFVSNYGVSTCWRRHGDISVVAFTAVLPDFAARKKFQRTVNFILTKDDLFEKPFWTLRHVKLFRVVL